MTIGERTVHTHCLICEQLCGLAVTVSGTRITAIHPDKQNPYTWRDFCVKAQRAAEVVSHPNRLRSPMRRVGDRYEPASYEEAIDDISGRLKAIIERHGRDAVGGYCGNPMGFSFGATVFHNVFLSTIGTHQKFSVQSIDSNAKHVAAGAMFGHEMLALVPDIDEADCVLLIGTNPAVSKFNWGGKVPNGWRRLKDRVRNGADLIVVDPRRTETAMAASLHLAPHPETDWALLLGVVRVILDERLDRLPDGIEFDGLEDLRRLAISQPLERLAGICDIPVAAIADLARRFAKAERGFAFAGTGSALGLHGVLTQWLTLALNVLTDRIDRPGGRFMPSWLTDSARQSVKAQVTRTQPAGRSRVRMLKNVVGQHSLAELADEITTPGEGQIRALILGGGNPVCTGPDGARLSDALRELDLLVCIDLFQRESHRDADWLIPAVHFLEREEIHVPLHAYNDRPFVQTSRQVVPPPEDVWPEWMFYRELAKAMGAELFGGAISNPDELASSMLAGNDAVTLSKIREAEHGLVYGERTMGHLLAVLREDRIAVRLCPEEFAAQLTLALERAAIEGTAERRLRMISRRRNGMMNSALDNVCSSAANDELSGVVEVNRDDARDLGIMDGDAVSVSSDSGAVQAVAKLSTDVRSGTVVIAHGWGSALLDPLTAQDVATSGSDRNRLVSSRDIDPLSAVPRLNGTLVSIARQQLGNADGTRTAG